MGGNKVTGKSRGNKVTGNIVKAFYSKGKYIYIIIYVCIDTKSGTVSLTIEQAQGRSINDFYQRLFLWVFLF